jgi:predicted permease
VQFGYDRDHLLIFSVNPVANGYKSAEIPQLYRNMLDRIGSIPGIRGATLMDNGLLGGTDSNSSISIEGGKPTSGGEDDEAHWDMVGPNFFSTTGIPILYGREIGPQDDGNGQRVGLLNQTAARHFFGNQNPIGSRILVQTTLGKQDFVVVGVVADSKHRTPGEKSQRRFYIPFFNPIGEASYASFLVRTAGDPSTVSSAVRAAVKQTAANLPPVEIETMNQRVAESLTSDRMVTRLAAAFGALAMVLVCIGLYGIMSYAVSARTSEIGIRMALGAHPSDVLLMILRQSGVALGIGLGAGLLFAFAGARTLTDLLYGVSPYAPLPFIGFSLVLAAVGVAASYIPARRATHVDPVVALRYE